MANFVGESHFFAMQAKPQWNHPPVYLWHFFSKES